MACVQSQKLRGRQKTVACENSHQNTCQKQNQQQQQTVLTHKPKRRRYIVLAPQTKKVAQLFEATGIKNWSSFLALFVVTVVGVAKPQVTHCRALGFVVFHYATLCGAVWCNAMWQLEICRCQQQWQQNCGATTIKKRNKNLLLLLLLSLGGLSKNLFISS